MTDREYAIDLVSSLSDEQVNILISFIKSFSDTKTKAPDSSAQNKKQAFEK